MLFVKNNTSGHPSTRRVDGKQTRENAGEHNNQPKPKLNNPICCNRTSGFLLLFVFPLIRLVNSSTTSCVARTETTIDSRVDRRTAAAPHQVLLPSCCPPRSLCCACCWFLVGYSGFGCLNSIVELHFSVEAAAAVSSSASSSAATTAASTVATTTTTTTTATTTEPTSLTSSGCVNSVDNVCSLLLLLLLPECAALLLRQFETHTTTRIDRRH